jgi:hypothetical protein
MDSMKHPIDSSPRTAGAPTRLAGGLALLSIAMLTASTALAGISINVGIEGPPPPPRQEVIVGVSPGPNFVWVGGYWGGAPGHYTWVAGRWDHPPHANGQWFAPHWDKGSDGHYHQTKGEWRDSPRH